MPADKPTALAIRPAPEGGYLVIDESARYRDPGYLAPVLFAATDLDDALAFVKKKLA